MDFITGLPVTKEGNNMIWVVVDRLSKMAHFIPTKDTIEATDVAEMYVKHISRLHGLPAEIISDRDTKFTSHFWRRVMTFLGIKHKMYTAFHPQTDGQTERYNAMLADLFRHYTSETQLNWEEHLPLAEFGINNTIHSGTKLSPFELAYGTAPITPTTLLVSHAAAQRAAAVAAAQHDKVPAAAKFRQEVDLRLSIARKHLAAAQTRMVLMRPACADAACRTSSMALPR